MVKRPTTFSMRMPEDLNEKILEYATTHGCTKAEAMSHFARAGIDLEENGGREAALQNLPTIDPAPSTEVAIVPIDIRDKIQAYSQEHNCSDQDALAYYARIGIQMEGNTRPASVQELQDLSKKLDALAADGASKTEKLNQMSEILNNIRDYTKPEEVELEGEVADEVEDVEETELTDEERQAIADEHTRKIVSDVMGEYAARQIEERRSEQPPMNPWIPVLVAVIVSLVIGLIVIVTR